MTSARIPRQDQKAFALWAADSVEHVLPLFTFRLRFAIRSSHRAILVRALAPALALAGCAAGERPAAPPAWPVSAAPTLRIGGDALPPGHELAGVVSARRLADGRFIVANSGALELAVFDSAGRFTGAVGRKGSGPGEFLGTIHVVAGLSDSVAVFDAGSSRWTMMTAALAPGRGVTSSASAAPRPVWVRKGALVSQGTLAPVADWVLSTIDSLRAADPALDRLIEARIDDTGALWVAAGPGGRWDVYPGPGLPLARVMIPGLVQILQSGRDFVLGVAADSMGVESIVQYALTRPSAGPSTASGPSTKMPRAVPSPLAGQLPRLIQAQEMVYSQAGAYTSTTDSLRAPFDPPAKVFLLYGDKRHWAGVVVSLGTLATCGVSVGFPAPAGWEDGTPLCDR